MVPLGLPAAESLRFSGLGGRRPRPRASAAASPPFDPSRLPPRAWGGVFSFRPLGGECKTHTTESLLAAPVLAHSLAQALILCLLHRLRRWFPLWAAAFIGLKNGRLSRCCGQARPGTPFRRSLHGHHPRPGQEEVKAGRWIEATTHRHRLVGRDLQPQSEQQGADQDPSRSPGRVAPAQGGSGRPKLPADVNHHPAEHQKDIAAGAALFGPFGAAAQAAPARSPPLGNFPLPCTCNRPNQSPASTGITTASLLLSPPASGFVYTFRVMPPLWCHWSSRNFRHFR